MFTQRLARAIHLDNKRRTTKVVGTAIKTTLPTMISVDRLAFNSASDVVSNVGGVAILHGLQWDGSPSGLDANEKQRWHGALYLIE